MRWTKVKGECRKINEDNKARLPGEALPLNFTAGKQMKPGQVCFTVMYL